MDNCRFDTLARKVGERAAPGTRRGLLRLLAALPLASSLAVLLDAGDAAQADGSGARVGNGHHPRRNRRRARHHRHPGTKRNHRHKTRRHHGRCAQTGETPGTGRSCCPELVLGGDGRCTPGTRPSGPQANGQRCGTGGECQSTYCAEGVCCNTACTGACETCASGTCVATAKATGTCAANIECCSGACTCGSSSNPEKGQCQVLFQQDFSRNADGWSGVTQRDGVGEVARESGAFTRWGGYSNVFPAGGYSTTLDIYLDLAAAANDTRFDWSSAVSTANCGFLRDFVFNVGVYSGTGTCPIGSGSRFVISASNNATRSGANPCSAGRAPITITSSGWYTFTHQFSSRDGVLVGSLTVARTDGTRLGSWELSDSADIIGEVVGGNRYGWFVIQEFPVLRIDNSARA